MTSERGGSSVAGKTWTTIQQTSHRLAGRSTYVWQQPETHSWQQLTA